jgi:hypothetical protein
MIGYTAVRHANGEIDVTSKDTLNGAPPSHLLHLKHYRLIPGPSPTIFVNGVSLDTLPPDEQRQHVWGLTHAALHG